MGVHTLRLSLDDVKEEISNSTMPPLSYWRSVATIHGGGPDMGNATFLPLPLALIWRLWVQTPRTELNFLSGSVHDQ